MPTYADFETLRDAAQLYLQLGYSVIPVWGDTRPAQAKVASIEWKPYQHRKPSLLEIGEWFSHNYFAGLAIITGTVSNGLIVLDFDDPALYQQFIQRHPDLATTRIIQTRRGYHLYFRLPPHLRIANRQVPGADLQSDGRYVVAPPTVIEGRAYRPVRGGLPKLLSAHDLARIERFLDALDTCKAPLPTKTASPAPITTSHEPIPLTEGDMVGLYRSLVGQGRNNALFQVSLRARDSGWTKEAVQRLLVEVHAHQPSSNQLSETLERRRHEAINTIESAFSRPPRRIQLQQPTQLPNSVREALLQCKLTPALRVVEGLRLKGVVPGQTFTEAQARDLLKNIVGAFSIREALTTILLNGTRLFELVTPSGHPLASKDAATHSKQNPISKCSEIGRTKSESNRRGRQKYLYQMPGNLELAAKLQVKVGLTSDLLTEDDLKSASSTRQAVAREFIKRRPGQYPRRWLAGRLGVSLPTLRRYHIEAEITALPTYHETPIHWWNLEREIPPDDIPLTGLFLQDEHGQKYPPLRALAGKLLKQGKRLCLKRQSYNTYFCGDRPPLPVRARLEPPLPEQYFQTWPRLEPPAIIIPMTPPPRRPPPVQAASEETTHLQPLARLPKSAAPTPQKRRSSKRRYKKPLDNNYKEWLAGRVYALIQRLTPDTNKHLSLSNARRLVDEYDPERVKAALGRTEHYRNLQNPAGFLIVYLRCTRRTAANSGVRET